MHGQVSGVFVAINRRFLQPIHIAHHLGWPVSLFPSVTEIVYYFSNIIGPLHWMWVMFNTRRHCTQRWSKTNRKDSPGVYRPTVAWSISWAKRPKVLDLHSSYLHRPLYHCLAHHSGRFSFSRCYCHWALDHRSAYLKECCAHYLTSIYLNVCENNT